jgi:geranylgeranyl pyrophosphate synthase
LIFGNDIAINDSNIMYFLPLILLYRNTQKLDEGTRIRIYDLYGQEMIRVSAGQAMDIIWHKGSNFTISEEEYLQMALCKTGVLARFSAKLGAILGNANARQEEALAQFGATIGVAFQIQDDILNLVGEEFMKGKGVGEDIHEGKRTLIVIRALKQLRPHDLDRLWQIIKSHPEDEKTILEAIGIIQKTDGVDYARQKSRELVQDAWKKLEPTLLPSEAKNTLKDFADYLIERKI